MDRRLIAAAVFLALLGGCANKKAITGVCGVFSRMDIYRNDPPRTKDQKSIHNRTGERLKCWEAPKRKNTFPNWLKR